MNNFNFNSIVFKRQIKPSFYQNNNIILFMLSFLLFIFSGCKNPLEMIKQEENKKVQYEVHHRLEKIREEDDDEYFEEVDVQYLEGFVGELTDAQPNNYPGFVSQYIKQKIIKEPQTMIEESLNENQEVERVEKIIRTVITFDYYRLEYNFTFMDGNEKVKTLTGKYESAVPRNQIPQLEKADVVFEGWSPAEIPNTFTSDMTFTAQWRSADANYTVIHRRQNINDNNYSFYEEETLSAPANRATRAVAKNYNGFTAKNITQELIREDGSTVVSVYYDRNVYTLSFNSNGGSAVQSVQGKFEASVPAITPPTRQGYVFAGWNPRLTDTFQNNVEYTASWTLDNVTRYKVEHYLQNTALNDYELEDVQTLTGTTNELTAAAPEEYEGFTANNFNQKMIQADGSTVIKIYYDRSLCVVSFMNDGVEHRVIRGRYGTPLPAIDNPIKIGYTFIGWSPVLPETYTTQTEYTAQWTPKTNTQYKVDFYLQNADRNGYTRRGIYTQTLTGTTGELTEAVPRVIDGYVVLNTFEQLPIAGDGSTVIAIYYDIAE